MTYAIIQHGYAIFGTGETLFDAVEDANLNLEAPVEYENIEMLERSSRVAGKIYWTTDQEEIESYQE